MHHALVECLLTMMPKPGRYKTSLAGVCISRVDAPMDRMPVLYPCGLVCVIQGVKHGYIGTQRLVYSPQAYLVTATPLPFESQIVEASSERPFLSLSLDIDAHDIRALTYQMEAHEVRVAHEEAEHDLAGVVRATPFDRRMQMSVLRLAQSLICPQEAAILGEGLKREVLYNVLCGPQADLLIRHSAKDQVSGRLADLIRHLNDFPQDKLTIEAMADRAALSPSAFFEHFKRATAMSPIQYQKHVRLHRAHHLLGNEGCSVGQAAEAVGYHSATQFSREYRRLFGHPPSQLQSV
ncbi:AraC family transcriptional regulator [Woodsholea maritima]|uniref:AraC family transcriptional regulator n=1 Tax=Woodsholea maritima TaxID=240237 RepID=UPI00037E378C|nr:AraC family transcriptional regulator [Woodsholea maritima]